MELWNYGPIWGRFSPKQFLGACLLTHLVLTRAMNKNTTKIFLLACGIYGDPELQLPPCAENYVGDQLGKV